MGAIMSRVVEIEDLLQSYSSRPPIHRQVMTGPNAPANLGTGPDRRDAHQRCLTEIESRQFVRIQEFLELELLSLGINMSPVELLDLELDTLLDDVNRFRHSLPFEFSPQQLVPVDDALPGLLKLLLV